MLLTVYLVSHAFLNQFIIQFFEEKHSTEASMSLKKQRRHS